MYLSKEEIIKRVYDCENLTEVEEQEEYVSAYDEDEGRYLYFHYLDNINYDGLFNFGTLKVNKEKFYKILKEVIDPILFLMPEKIFFVSSEKELDDLMDSDEYCSHYMDMNNALGINWSFDNAIVINVKLAKELAKEEEKKFMCNYDTLLNEILWTTLIHELRHMICDNGLIVYDNEIPISEGEEDKVEEYCNNIFDNEIVFKDFIVFE